MPSKTAWLGLALGVLLLAGALWMAARKDGRTGDVPRSGPLRLVAVRPACGDALFDRHGRPAGTSLYDGQSLPFWSSNMMQRGFLFEIRDASPGPWLGTCQIRPGRHGAFLLTAGLEMKRAPEGRILLEGGLTLPRKVLRPFLIFWRKQDGLETVDLTVQLHDSSGQDPEATFRGPFILGQQQRSGDLLTLQRMAPDREAENLAAFRIIKTSPDAALPAPVFLLAGGRRVSTLSMRTSNSGTRSQLDCLLMLPVKGDEVVEIRIPRLHTARFEDVVVEYPKRPERGYPEAYDHMAAAIGITKVETGVRMGYKWTSSPEVVLQSLEHLRGPHILSGWRTLSAAHPPQPGSNAWSTLSEPDQLRVRQTARAWTQAAAPDIRLAGVEMGLAGAWPEFVAPARDLVQLDEKNISARAAEWLRLHEPDHEPTGPFRPTTSQER